MIRNIKHSRTDCWYGSQQLFEKSLKKLDTRKKWTYSRQTVKHIYSPSSLSNTTHRSLRMSNPQTFPGENSRASTEYCMWTENGGRRRGWGREGVIAVVTFANFIPLKSRSLSGGDRCVRAFFSSAGIYLRLHAGSQSLSHLLSYFTAWGSKTARFMNGLPAK